LPPTEEDYHEISLFLDYISYQHVDVSVLSGDRTRLSAWIDIWAGTMDRMDKGFSSVTMAQECPPRVLPRTKSSMPNERHHRWPWRASGI